MARSIYVPLSTPAKEALYQLAEREWRHPKEQASKLLVEALRQAGALPADPDQLTSGSPAAAERC
jgi:hypothetical protein